MIVFRPTKNGVIKFDIEDIALFGKASVRKQKSGNSYVEVWDKKNKKSCYLHRLVMGASNKSHYDVLIDHIDGNGLNNCKSNLRISNHSLNQANRKTVKGKSKYKGVSFCKQTNKWRATLERKENNKRKTYSAGRWETEKEAALAYNKKAVELFGEHAHLNRVP